MTNHDGVEVSGEEVGNNSHSVSLGWGKYLSLGLAHWF
jgi:hypothetical protein